MRLIVLVASLAILGACKEQPTRDQVDVADVNSRNALIGLSDLNDRVDQLESDKTELESRFDAQGLENDRLNSEIDSLRSEIDLLNTRLAG